MIYVLKKDEMYVLAAIGHLRVDRQTGGMLHKERIPNTKVQFQMTKDITKARLVENPNMNAVVKYGLTLVQVQQDIQPKLIEIGTTYEIN